MRRVRQYIVAHHFDTCVAAACAAAVLIAPASGCRANVVIHPYDQGTHESPPSRTATASAIETDVAPIAALLGFDLSNIWYTYHESIKVDPETLVVEMVGTVRQREVPGGLYYTGGPIPNWSSRYWAIAEYRRGNDDGSYDLIEYILIYEREDRLEERRKSLELLRGDYGVISTHVLYQYTYPVSDGLNGGSFRTSARQLPPSRYQSPKVIDALPDADLPLHVVSIVRVMRWHDLYLVASADYSTIGELRAYHQNAMEPGGNTLSHNDERLAGLGVQMAGGGPLAPMGSRAREYSLRYSGPGLSRFGIPMQFPVTQYLAGNQDVFEPTDLPVVLEAVHFHYEFSRWIRQDILTSPDGPAVRYLEFEWTELDEALREIDGRIPPNTSLPLPTATP